MARGKKNTDASVSLESAPAKPKRRRATVKAVVESGEPTPLSAVLDQSPIAAMIADQEARAKEESERVPASFAEKVRATRPSFGPIPSGFVNVDSYPAAGLKVNRSLDKKVVAVQFAEDRLPTRPEKDIHEAINGGGQGFVYKTARRQWERYDPESPGANLVDAKRVAADMARERQEIER